MIPTEKIIEQVKEDLKFLLEDGKNVDEWMNTPQERFKNKTPLQAAQERDIFTLAKMIYAIKRKARLGKKISKNK
jgi:hypothetical protein